MEVLRGKFPVFTSFISVITGLDDHIWDFKSRFSFSSSSPDGSLTGRNIIYGYHILTPLGYNINTKFTNQELLQKWPIQDPPQETDGRKPFIAAHTQAISTLDCPSFVPIFDILTHSYPSITVKKCGQDQTTTNSLDYMVLSLQHIQTFRKQNHKHNDYIDEIGRYYYFHPTSLYSPQMTAHTLPTGCIGFYNLLKPPISQSDVFSHLFQINNSFDPLNFMIELSQWTDIESKLYPDWTKIEPVMKHSAHLVLPPPSNPYQSDILTLVDFKPIIVDSIHHNSNETIRTYTNHNSSCPPKFLKSHYPTVKPQSPHGGVYVDLIRLGQLPLISSTTSSLSTPRVSLLNSIIILDQTSKPSIDLLKSFLYEINIIQRSDEIYNFKSKPLLILLTKREELDQHLISENDIIVLCQEIGQFDLIEFISYVLIEDDNKSPPKNKLLEIGPNHLLPSDMEDKYTYNPQNLTEMNQNSAVIFGKIWDQIWPQYFTQLSQHYSNQRYARQEYAKLSQLILHIKFQLMDTLSKLRQYKNSTSSYLPKAISDKMLLSHPICARAIWELQLVPFHATSRFRNPIFHPNPTSCATPASLFPFSEPPPHSPHSKFSIDRVIERLYYIRRNGQLYSPFLGLDIQNGDFDKFNLDAVLPNGRVIPYDDDGSGYRSDWPLGTQYLYEILDKVSSVEPYLSVCEGSSLNVFNNYGSTPVLDEFRKEYPVESNMNSVTPSSVIKFFNVVVNGDNDDDGIVKNNPNTTMNSIITFIPHDFSEFQIGLPNYNFLSSPYPNPTTSTNSITHKSNSQPISLSITSQLFSQFRLTSSFLKHHSDHHQHHHHHLQRGTFFKKELPNMYLPDAYISSLISTGSFNTLDKWRDQIPYLSPKSKQLIFKHFDRIANKTARQLHYKPVSGSFENLGIEASICVCDETSEDYGLTLSLQQSIEHLPPGQLPDELYFNTSILIEPRVLSTGLPNLYQIRDLYQFDPYKAFPEAMKIIDEVIQVPDGIKMNDNIDMVDRNCKEDKSDEIDTQINNLNEYKRESENVVQKQNHTNQELLLSSPLPSEKKYPKHYQPSTHRNTNGCTALRHLLYHIDPLMRKTFGKSSYLYSSINNTGVPYAKYISPHRCETTVIVPKQDIANLHCNVEQQNSNDNDDNPINITNSNNTPYQSNTSQDPSLLSDSIQIKTNHLVRNDAYFYQFNPASSHFEQLIHPTTDFQKVSAAFLAHFLDAQYVANSGPLSSMGYYGTRMPLLFAVRILPYVFYRITDDLTYNRNVFYPLTSPLINELAIPNWKSNNPAHKNINIKLPPLHIYFETANSSHIQCINSQIRHDEHGCVSEGDNNSPQSPPSPSTSSLQYESGQVLRPLQGSRRTLLPTKVEQSRRGLDSGSLLHIGTPFETHLEAITRKDQQRSGSSHVQRPFNMQMLKIPIAFVIFCVNPIVSDDFEPIDDEHDINILNDHRNDEKNHEDDDVQPHLSVRMKKIAKVSMTNKNQSFWDGAPGMKFDYLTQSEFDYLRQRAYYEYKQQIVDVLYHTSPLPREEVKDLVTVYFISPPEWPKLFLKLQQDGIMIRLSLLFK
jgi:hypothetical protein